MAIQENKAGHSRLDVTNDVTNNANWIRSSDKKACLLGVVI